MKNNVFKTVAKGSISQAFNLRELQAGAITIKESDRLIQYTGRNDSNGIPIFEGDIIKYTRNKVTINGQLHDTIVFLGDVFFSPSEYQYSFHHEFNNGASTSSRLMFNDDRAQENICEVMGNIFESPNLIFQLRAEL